MNHVQTFTAIARADTPAAQRRAVMGASPAGLKAIGKILVAASQQHGLGPKDPTARAQLQLLAHPAATHADHQRVLGTPMVGGGLFSFLGGLAKGVLGIFGI